MSFSEKLVQIRLTAAVVIDGEIIRAKQIVEMVESEAKDLLRRGKAELHAIVDSVEGKDPASADAATAAQPTATATEPQPNTIDTTPEKKAK